MQRNKINNIQWKKKKLYDEVVFSFFILTDSWSELWFEKKIIEKQKTCCMVLHIFGWALVFQFKEKLIHYLMVVATHKHTHKKTQNILYK